jgi:hypothetical protein
VAAETGAKVPDPAPYAELQPSALRLEHPVIAGYDGSASSRNALAYAAGVSQRLGRALAGRVRVLVRGSTVSR